METHDPSLKQALWHSHDPDFRMRIRGAELFFWVFDQGSQPELAAGHLRHVLTHVLQQSEVRAELADIEQLLFRSKE